MMKNSKLSKLLVAGVSIAMLTSALAPMAFAEESTTSSVSDTTYSVYVRGTTVSGSLSIHGTNVNFKDSNGTANTTSGDNRYIVYTYNVNYVDHDANKGVESIVPTNDGPTAFDISAFTPLITSNKAYVVDTDSGWVLSTGAATSDETIIKSISVEDLFEDYSYSADSTNYSNISFPLKEVATATVTVEAPTTGALAGTAKAKAGKVGETALYDKDTAENAAEKTVYAPLTADVVLPTYSFVPTNTDKAAFDGVTVVAKVGGAEKGKIENLGNGATFSLSDSRLNLGEYLKGYEDGEATTAVAITIEITAKFKDVSDKAVKLIVENVNTSIHTVVLDEDDKEKDADNADKVKTDAYPKVVAVDTYNDGLLASVVANYPSSGKKVVYGDTVKLPELKVVKLDTKTSKEVDNDNYKFLGWEVVCDKDVLADGVTPANGFVITDNTFKASDFKASKTDNETELKLVPKFLYTKTEDVHVYTFKPAVKNPNDTMNNYTVFDEKGKKVNVSNAPTTTWADFVEFEGGIFTDDKGVVSYYADKKDFNGKWVIDTTFTDIADDIYFVNGVQDTSAYGLKSYSGAEGWNFLVANGVVARDYNGLWISPEGVWYYLTKGCCQIPAEGIFQNTKDETLFHVFAKGKIDKTANGLKLYGDTWYNFVNGGCDTKAPTTVVEQDGAFFYVKAGVVDTTFSGEYEGHTFVNGWAAK